MTFFAGLSRTNNDKHQILNFLSFFLSFFSTKSFILHTHTRRLVFDALTTLSFCICDPKTEMTFCASLNSPFPFPPSFTRLVFSFSLTAPFIVRFPFLSRLASTQTIVKSLFFVCVSVSSTIRPPRSGIAPICLLRKLALKYRVPELTLKTRLNN